MNDSRTVCSRVRVLDIDAGQLGSGRDLIEEVYRNELDVLVIRYAFDPAPLARVGAYVDTAAFGLGWVQPNPTEMAGEDIYVLGVPLTPSGKRPEGPYMDAYFAKNLEYRALIDSLFGATFDPDLAFRSRISQAAGGKPALTPEAGPQEAFAPYTLRLLREGQGIGVHHDHHFSLKIYEALRAEADNSLVLSFITPLSVPTAGGELIVYGLTLDNPDKPALPNGRWDHLAIERRFDRAVLTPAVGDLVIFASGRCLHRVAPVVGDRPRVTLGGFLAFDRHCDRVLYWS